MICVELLDGFEGCAETPGGGEHGERGDLGPAKAVGSDALESGKEVGGDAAGAGAETVGDEADPSWIVRPWEGRHGGGSVGGEGADEKAGWVCVVGASTETGFGFGLREETVVVVPTTFVVIGVDKHPCVINRSAHHFWFTKNRLRQPLNRRIHPHIHTKSQPFHSRIREKHLDQPRRKFDIPTLTDL